MNRFLKHWRLTGCGEAFRAQIIAYADDFVILSCGHAAEAMMWTKAVMTKLGLSLNEAKTSISDAYVQHQFEMTFWAHEADWSFEEAALHGSSYYHLPGVLRWFTANIGVHHVHHLCSRIPCYRLPDVLRDHPELTTVGRINLFQSLQCASLALWDEKRRRLISFGEAGAIRQASV